MSINPDMLTAKGLEAIAQRSKAKRTGRPCVGAGDRTQAENEAERDELWESTLCEKREKAKDPFIVCAALGVVLMGLFGQQLQKSLACHATIMTTLSG
jgi:hypothetical protein